jgi:hypothetical protein
MNMMNTPSASATLATRAMLVSLSISQWSGRRLDREVTDEVNSSHNAANDAGRYNKLLLPKEALKDIVSIVSETRTGFTERTLPWMDGGTRIMAADAYMAHSSWLNKQQAKFNAAVDDFLLSYPAHVNAARARLSGMFKDEDYPDVSELRAKFGIEIKILPVPTSEDFRVDISDAQAIFLRNEIERNVTEATRLAVRDVYGRIAEATKRMAEKLKAYKPATGTGNRAEGVFRDSLVENIRDLIGLLPGLNITGDPELAKMADALKPLAVHDASTLREDAILRTSVAEEAAAIFANVSDYMS